MTFSELKAEAIKEYYPALFLEWIYPRKLQKSITAGAWILSGLLFIAMMVLFSFTALTNNPSIDIWLTRTIGLLFLSMPLWMISIALSSFYNSYNYKGMRDINDLRKPQKINFELAKILYYTKDEDILAGFLRTPEGMEMMLRAGIKPDDTDAFITTKKTTLSTTESIFLDTPTLSLAEYGMALYEKDQEFADFLFSHSVQKKDFEAITAWVEERILGAKRKKRWWSRDRLGRVSGIGKNWSYGGTVYLDEYTLPLHEAESSEIDTHSVYGSKELEQLESVLIKGVGANAFLIGNDKEGLIQILARLNSMIEEGTAYPEIEHKRIVLFDAEMLATSQHNKSNFELKLLNLMNEAVKAGNIILVFVNFPAFLASAQALGSDVSSLLDRYFTSTEIQMVALTDVDRFHQVIEGNGSLMQRFEKIYIQDIDESNTIHVLQNEIIAVERHFGIVFSYPALVEIAEGAVRYFPDAIMPDRAIELMGEVAPKIASKGKRLVTKDDVLELITSKTGIPVGEVKGEERSKLINLEKILHQRIIGQDDAVEAISNAARRARSGINNPNRPLASFLFLGPTGVGKTETTKALAEVFFGAEAKVERLDMSEYTSSDALSKLIGSFEAGKAGVLSTMLREHPYGVLLLDEFEKTIPEVMNLFLQVLDEGFFSDMSGKRINARNLLIIATSNAGSELIWEALKKGNDLSHSKDLIIDSIIQHGIMKPELLNRFDGVIVFHPLAAEHLNKIAQLQLEKLQKRLAERGIKLAITDDLIKYVITFGTDPKFGARPMNRAIQDKVEQVIADKMIKGEFRQGSEIRLETKDLQK